jgi:hypothetical protein
MIPADRNATTLLDCAVRVQDVVSRPPADIEHQCSEILLVLGQNNLGRSKPAENDVLNV